MSNQIATSNTKEKKAGQAELARKINVNDGVTTFRVFFAAYGARVQDPLAESTYSCYPAKTDQL